MPLPKSSKDRDFEIRTTDYLHLVCIKCDEDAVITYLGLDPSIPRIRVACSKCGVQHTWKLFNARDFPGLPPTHL
jgi:hypothetical protein